MNEIEVNIIIVASRQVSTRLVDLTTETRLSAGGVIGAIAPFGNNT